jgi:V-type H+-transporting ATPase subunit a
MVDTFGIPRYQEANPGLFYIVTFPFMFGVMFGDVGHGVILTTVAVYMMLYHNDPLSKLYQLRWLFVLMGAFAVYCGMLYNEFFAMPLLFSKSCYEVKSRRRKEECVYFFGMDWIWSISVHETSFVNSFKMKFAIILGVIHMLWGIILKGSNSFHFSSLLDFVFEVVPQFVFLMSTFGYMSFCIIIKWL